ncbi:MAG: hypothetical protein J0H14_27255 [Alphaproteobacteria bacterium]|nr:hypothetical protein [Alphaproteobacteria bacterium]
MTKGHDRPGREAKKPKKKKTSTGVAPSSFLHPQGTDRPTPAKPAVTPAAPDKA